MTRKTSLVGLVAVLVVASQACAQKSRAPAGASQDSIAVTRFSQEFLDWYVPLTGSAKRVAPWWQTLSRTPPVVGAGLARALRADSAARVQPVDSRQALDFEPFLNGQDPCERYVVTAVQPQGAVYRVSVTAVCSGRAQPRPASVLEVASTDGRWEIENVWYGKKDDLKSMLCRFAQADIHPEGRPKKCW